MQRFATLLDYLERAGDAPARVTALGHYFSAAPPADAAWAVFLLAGGRLRRALRLAQLRLWVGEASRLPTWLVEESIQAVGDGAEALSLLLPQHLPPPVPETGGPPQAQQEMSFNAVDPVVRLDLNSPTGRLTLAKLIEDRVLALAATDQASQKAVLWNTWSQLSGPERWVWHQLLAGTVHAASSRRELVEALSIKAGLPPTVIEHRLRALELPDQRPGTPGKPRKRHKTARRPDAPTAPHDAGRTGLDSPSWIPTAESYLDLLAPFDRSRDAPAPGPFCATSNLAQEPASLGEPEEWICQWQWGGTRAQLIRHDRGSVLWTNEGEDITAACPAIILASARLPPGTSLEGAVLAWAHDRPLPMVHPPAFRRPGHRQPPAQPTVPIVFMASDLLQCGGVDWRREPLVRRRQQLERVLETFLGSQAQHQHPDSTRTAHPGDFFLGNTSHAAEGILPEPAIRLSPRLPLESWSEAHAHRKAARAHGAEGLVFKPANSPHPAGGWLIWPAAPFVVDAVLVGIQPAPGGVPSTCRAYTVAVWDGLHLVPIAQALCELAPAEADDVEVFAKDNTLTRFGPVRALVPELVIELAFAGMVSTHRRRSGFLLNQPRAIRLRRDRSPEQAATLALLRSLLNPGTELS